MLTERHCGIEGKALKQWVSYWPKFQKAGLLLVPTAKYIKNQLNNALFTVGADSTSCNLNAGSFHMAFR